MTFVQSLKEWKEGATGHWSRERKPYAKVLREKQAGPV